ncbi:MAG TPA: hypothetical protein VN805_15385 [Caulobacteraceae bacterium]|nr:hypothetical protein [Caulobacteraceae bacterium]
MKRLLVAAALAPLVFAAAARAGTITGADTKTHSTSAEGDITVNTGASVTPATSATSGTVAILLNSNNNITVDGAITVTEKTTGDSTNQGVTTGPFANGSDRFGIEVSGAGPFTGDITTNAGASITVIGENSAGIAVETGLNGFILDNGTITVTGGNANTTDVSYGLLIAPGAFVTGDVSIGGAISATGGNATGAAINGNVSGSLDVSSTITATGFRSTTPPVAPSTLAALTPDQLLIGGPALSIGASIVGGVTIEGPTAASGNIAATSGGSLNVFGSAPALLIGGASPIYIGPGGTGFGVTIGGTVAANGDYPNVSATAIQIGGVNPLPVSSGGVAPSGNFSTVTLSGGLDITGAVSATSTATKGGDGAATAIEIGTGATVPVIDISGSVSAVGANTLTPSDVPPGNVTAILIQPGAAPHSTVLVNSGSILAEVTGVAGVAGVTESAGGVVGNAVAILDTGGGLNEIVNRGNITAAITPAISGAATAGNVAAIVVDNAAPLLIVQCSAVDSTGACVPSGNATLSPNITGEVNLSGGTGAVSFLLWGGNVTGGIAFGSSPDNFLDIENGGFAKGPLTVADGGSVDLNVNDGVLFDTVPGNVSVSFLHIGSHGAVVFTGVAAEPDGSVFNVAGNATIDSGATVGLSLSVPLTGPETFTLIQTTAGNLTVGNVSSALLGQLPILESGAINVTNDSLSITATPKTVAQLGLNPAEAAEFEAFIKALPSDPAVSADVLSKLTLPGFIQVYNQFLPDYSGGPFEDLVVGQQEVARAIADPPAKLENEGTRGWVQEIGYINHEANSPQVNGYSGLGFGFASGIERVLGNNAIGLTGVFLTTGVQDQTQPNDQALSASAFEAGAYWRYGAPQKGLSAYAAVSGGVVSFGSHRFLVDAADANDLLATTAGQIVSREAKASWLGEIVSANVGVSYQVNAGWFYLQPEVAADYVALFQPSYREHGGGTAFDLSIAPGTASQADVQGDVVIGMNLGRTTIWRPQFTFGYRAVVAGGPASTVASFTGGQSFTLNPQFTDKSGFLARFGLRASGQYADFSADAGGVFSSGFQTYDARAAARFLF